MTPTPEERQELQVYEAEASDYVTTLAQFQITTPEQMNLASKICAELNDRLKHLEARRKEITVPLNAALKSVNDLFRPIASNYTQGIQILKSRITKARAEEQERARVAIEALQEAAAASDHEAIQEAIQTHDRAIQTTVAPGLQFRKIWKFRITDETKIPREFLAVDETAIRKHVMAHKGDTQIPGVEVFQEESVAST